MELSMQVESFLFGRGQKLEDYFIEQTPVSEILCYRNAQRRCFDLPINDEQLAAAAGARLKELGVAIHRMG